MIEKSLKLLLRKTYFNIISYFSLERITSEGIKRLEEQRLYLMTKAKKSIRSKIKKN